MRTAVQARPSRRPEAAQALPISSPADAHEREADRIADAMMRAPAGKVTPLLPRGAGVQRQATAPAPAGLGQVPAGAGAPLPAPVRGRFEPRFGRSLRDVRIHTGAGAANAASGIGARAFTLGSDIYFGGGEYAPGTDRGLRLLAHEVTHTLQPAAAGRLSRKTLGDVPEATRKGLRVSRNTPEQAAVDGWITNYFDPKSGISGQPAADVEFDGNITDARQQKGFKGVANELETLTTVLPVGSIVDLAMDLRPQAGEHGVFRFTHYTDGKTTKILIERIHTLAPAPVAGAPAPATPPASPAAAAAPTGTVAIGAIKVEIGSSFTGDRPKQIVDAIGLMPAPIQAKADGVRFSYEGSGLGPNGRAGDYNSTSDSVQVWGDLFDAAPRRVGKATVAAASILHELGHAIDLRPLFKAQNARDKARKDKKTAQDALAHPKIDLDNPDPLATGSLSSDEEKRLKDAIAAADKEIATQDKAMKTAKSIAGDELGDGKDSEQLLTDFGKALAADGIKAVKDARKTNRKIEADNKAAQTFNEANPDKPAKPLQSSISTLSGNVTDYADTDLMEAYAENFSIYILDELLLQAIRPNTFAFFVKSLPKTAPAAPAAAKP